VEESPQSRAGKSALRLPHLALRAGRGEGD
jgi:hypothetical protein